MLARRIRRTVDGEDMEQQPEHTEEMLGPVTPVQQAVKAYEANTPDAQRVSDNSTRHPHADFVPSGEDQVIIIAKESMPAEPVSSSILPNPEITLSHPDGTYDAPFVLKLNCSVPGAVIYYTMDGSEPGLASVRYSTQHIPVNRSATITARACINGQLCGEPLLVRYTLHVSSIRFSVDAGVYNPPLTVAISCPTDGTTIFYTLDGSEPTAASIRYDTSDALLLRNTVTVKAFACKEGWESSDVCTAAYELKAPQWLELDPTEQQDPVPHAVSELGNIPGGWTITAASVRGKLHAHRALWRDDAYRYATEGLWTIIAVSDGAGSAPLSRVGSHIACDSATNHLIHLLTNYAMQEPIDAQQPVQSDLVKLRDNLANAALQAKMAIGEEARKRNCPFNHFAATLLLVIHCRWKQYDFAAAIQVGDGAIALWNQDDTASLLGVADHGEHSSETKFLTTKNIEDEFLGRVLFTMKEHLRGIAVMTDGVSDDFFPEDQRIVELFTGRAIAGMTQSDESQVDGLAHTVITAEKPDEALLDWLKYSKKGSSDDRTIVLFFGDNA
jgi:serine/threonine protein phosphatase PrpC